MAKKIKYILPLLAGLLPAAGTSSNSSYIPQTGKEIVEVLTSDHSIKETQGIQADDFLVVEKGYKDGKEKIKKFDTIDPPHDKIVNMNVDSILQEYGQEKGMTIINNHFLIEINTLRESLQLTDLGISNEVMRSSQKQAEYLDGLGQIEHMSGEQVLWKRLKMDTIEFYTCGENLAEGETTLQQLINDWKASEGHKETMIDKNFTKIGLGYKNGKRVLILIG
ncbi:MAG: CAP domain-containing protein [Candidatus Absconditabacterales bacterium]